MWYNTKYENTHFYPSFHRRRTTPDPEGTAFVRCFYHAPLPDFEGISAWGTSPSYRSPTGMRRSNRTQCDPRIQRGWLGGAARGLLAPPPSAHQLLRGRAGALARPAAPQSERFWQSAWSVD